VIGRLRRRGTHLTTQPFTIVGSFLSGTLLVIVFATTTPVAAQTDTLGGEDGPTLRIVDQNTFVAADGSLELLVELLNPPSTVDGDPSSESTPQAAGNEVGGADADIEADGETEVDTGPELVLSPVVYGRLSNEDEVDGPPGTVVTRLAAIPLTDLEPAGTNRWRLTVPIRSSDRFDGQERALLREPGVYPVTLELRDADGPLASVRTHLVRLPVETSDIDQEPPIPLSIVLAISTAEGLSVADVVALLNEHPTMPLTVLLGPGVINRLEDDPEATAALVSALAERPVLATPTIDLDPSALAEIGQSALFLDAARTDRNRLRQLGLRPATAIGLLEAPLTTDGVAVVEQLGWEAVLDVGGQRSTSVRLGLGADSQRFTIIRPDAELTALLDRSPLTSPDDGSFRANQVLARLALRGVGSEEAVVLGGPALGLDAKDALAAVLRALTRPGGPRPVSLGTVPGGPSERPAERPAQDLRSVADQVAELQARLVTFEGFAQGGDPDGDPAFPAPPTPALAMTDDATGATDGDQRLVAALTRQRNPADRDRALALLDSQLTRDLGVIELHDPQPVTLAARRAPLPVVLDNNAGETRTVLLRFRSDGLVSPDDGRVVEIGPGTSSINVDIEARSLGVSPLEVSVWTPDGTTQLAAAQFDVRSTAIPGVGIAVSLVAGAVLALWWWVDRSRRAEAAATPNGGKGADTLG
jgi:hypothetical protein